MNYTLITCGGAVPARTLAIGVWAGTRIKSTSDFAVAGRSLPLIMVVTTTFATWFGAETVMGIPARFVQGGLNSIVEDPFGAGTCLILVGMFFAARLYKLNLLTIGDYYRQRFGKGIEVFCSLAIILSYLGWVAAQITALGLVFSVLTNGAMSEAAGMIVGTLAVLIYVVAGGFLAVAITDFIQMIVLVIGLSIIAFFSADLAGGAGNVLAMAEQKDLWKFLPPPSFHDITFFIGAAVTMMFGSIPQQDVFQRVMSAKNAPTARTGAMIGGASYILFAFVPMFIVASAVLVMGQSGLDMAKNDYQRLLPTFVMTKMPLAMQILFFGALLSAIKSTSSATLLAPSTSFVENILKNLRPEHDGPPAAVRGALLDRRLRRLGAGVCDQDAGHHDLRAGLERLPGDPGGRLRAAGDGPVLEACDHPGRDRVDRRRPGGLDRLLPADLQLGEHFPGQLAGLIAAFIGMIAGSLAPQVLQDRKEAVIDCA
jgi:SSS family solute:Na+ symporter